VRSERPGPPPLRNDSPPAEREFWEVWSEERAAAAQAPGPGAGDAATGASDAPLPSIPPPTGGPDALPMGGAGTVSLGGYEARGDEAPRGDVARLYLNLGRKDGASDRDIRSLLEAHAPGAQVSDVDVMNTHTYLNVAPGDSDRIVRGLTGQELAGRQLICEPAKPRRR